ncbi:hypothetical protein [Minisyncoccus archaeiphilus]|uniref:hypothetical protein n=1 Tax=Minisyncoccus archaeiphilus TaxID=3238481 RepID=UPI00399C8C73
MSTFKELFIIAICLPGSKNITYTKKIIQDIATKIFCIRTDYKAPLENTTKSLSDPANFDNS